MIRILKAEAFITTPGMNEYDDILGELDSQKGAKTSRAIYSAADSNPDQESAFVKISRRSGVPVEALRLDDGAEAKRRIASKEAENLVDVAPATANWLSSPENARLAHDDVEKLAELERVARQGFGQQANGGSTLGIASQSDQRAAARAKSIGSAFVEGLASSPEKVNEGLATVPVVLADLVNWSLEAFPDETGMRKRFADSLRGNVDYWKKAGDAKKSETTPQTAESYFQQAGGSIGTSLLAAPFGMAGKDAALGAFALFADGGYQGMKDKGVSVPMAAALSTSSSMMEGLTEKLGLDALYKGSAPVLKKAIGFLLGDLAGEEINAVYSAISDKVTIKPDMTMGDVLQQVIDTAIVTSIAGPAQGVSMSGAAKASGTLFSQFQTQQEARKQSDFLLSLGDSVKASKTFARLPSAVQDLVREIKKDGAVQDVYVPVERFSELFQSAGMDPGKAADQILSDPARYYEAVATGVDVAIPLEEFARLADAPFYGELVKDARTSLAGMTAREAEELGGNSEARINDLLAQAAEEDPVEDPTYQTAYQQIYDDTFGQLVGVNQAPGEAEANATIRAKGLATLAQRYGYDPAALMEQFPLTVTRGDLPAALQRQPSFTEQQQGAQLSAMLDAIRSGKSKNSGEMFGPSLGEFLRTKGINDDRGDLAAMDVDKGIKFKKKMLRKDGMSLDLAREAAAEAGYLPAESTVADLLDLVDSELRGNPTYAPGNINQSLVDQQDSHDELAQWLGMMGVDLGETDNDKILQMMQAAIAGGDQLDQSQQVDEATGLPLNPDGTVTVYHHTSKAKAAEIRKSGVLKAEAEPDVYVTTRKETDTGYGDTAVPIQVKPELLQLDDEFPDGRADYRLSVGKPGGSIKVKVGGAVLDQSAWHGSPHTFDKFMTSAIGTGEGAQAYGYGLYFTDKKEIATHYRDMLKTDKPWSYTSKPVMNPRTGVWEYSAYQSGLGGGRETFNSMEEAKAFADGKNEENSGRLYAVELAPKEDEYLLYDKPLSEQSDKVRAALRAGGVSQRVDDMETAYLESLPASAVALAKRMITAGKGRLTDGSFESEWDEIYKLAPDIDHNDIHDIRDMREDGSGSDIYEELSDEKGGDEEASKFLHSLGIRGIKYLDGSSRNNLKYVPITAERREEITTRLNEIDKVEIPGAKDGAAYKALSDERNGLAMELAQADAEPENFNYVIFSEDDVSITQMFQAQKDKKRGYIKINDSLPGFEIALLKDADASTFIHELGHYYEVILGRLAAQDGAPEQLKADYQTVLAWLGATDTEALTVEQREQFARGFEAYLFEGSAPSQDLRGVFQRFKVWLKAVYSSLKSLNVELSDDVRGVFDRLLATDEEIAAAEREQNVKPMYATAEDAGMSAAVFAAYRQLGERAHEEAKDKLEQKKLREVKRAHETWWKEARAKMAEEVEAEAKQDPVFEAINFLKTGTLYDGSTYQGESFKLSGAELLKAYDSGTVKGIRKRLGNVYSKTGGISPAVVAEMFGFSSVDELVKKMMEAPKLRDFVKAETDRRMEELHGKMNSAEIAEEAINAVFNDDQAKLLREELKAIRRKTRDVKPFTDAVKGEGKAALSREKAEREYERRWFEAEKALALAIEKGVASVEIDRLKAEAEKLKAEIGHSKAERAYELRWMEAERRLSVAIEKGAMQAEIDDLKESIRADKEQARAARKFDKDTVPPVEAFKESARRHIATLKVSEILPGKYSRAEAKASQESFTLNGKGQYSEAAAAKTRQLLNHYLFREATAAKAEADKIAANMRKLESSKAQARIGKAGADYLEQVNALLEQYEFKRQTGKVLAERERLIDWVERMEKANGFPPPIPPSILEDSLQVNFRTLTMQELRDVNDAVKAITFMARMNGKIMKAQEALDIHTLAVEAKASIEANSRGERPRLPEKSLPQDVPGRMMENYFASHRKMSSLARQMDGGQDGGVMWNLIIRPMNEAGDNEAVMRAEAAGNLNDIFRVYSAVERTKMHMREFIPAINSSMSKWGRIVVALNMGNDGNRQRLGSMYNAFEVDAIVDGLDGRDWQFVQSVWDLLQSYWPLIEAKEKRVSGVAPQQVEHTPLQTKFGPLQGGYWPIKYDAEETAKAGAQQEQEILQQMMGGAFTRATTRHGHTEARLEAVNRPLTLSIDVLFQHLNQVIHDLTHHEMLYDVNRLLGTKEIQEAVRDHYGMEIYRVFTEGLRDVAVGDIPAQGAFERFMNYTRVGISTAGLGWNLVTSMMQPLGLTQSMVRIGPRWVGKGIGRWIGSPKSMVETADWIYEKSSFMETRALTQNREIAEIRNQMTVGVIPHAVRDSFFYFIQQCQKVVDIPTWLGQYEKSMANHGKEDDAIAEADQAVIDSQASGQMKDLAGVQKGGPMKKMFTTFYSFFSTTYNLAAESKAKTDFKSPSEVGRFMVDMLMLYTVPVILTTMLKESIQHAIGGGGDDDELLKKLASEQLGYIMGGFIGLREFGSIFSGFQGYEGPTGSRFYSEAAKLVKEIGQGEADAGLYKRLNSVGGILFHYPATQIQRTVLGMNELAEGRGNLLSLLFGKPKK